MFDIRPRLVLRHRVGEHFIGDDQDQAQCLAEGFGLAAEQGSKVPYSEVAAMLHHQRDKHVLHSDFAWKKLSSLADTKKFNHSLKNLPRFYACFLINKLVTLRQDPFVAVLGDFRIAFLAKFLLQLCNPFLLVSNNIEHKYSKIMRLGKKEIDRRRRCWVGGGNILRQP